MEQIVCKKCTSPDCRGCNLLRLEQMLESGKFDALMDEKHGIKTGIDVRSVVLCRDCKWYEIDELKKDGTEDRRYKPSVCMLAEQRREPNHFCADGEKKEET